MEKKEYYEFEVTPPQYVGMYCLGNKQLCISLITKPNWFHRTMMKVCLGWKWIDINKIKGYEQ